MLVGVATAPWNEFRTNKKPRVHRHHGADTSELVSFSITCAGSVLTDFAPE